ncbi:MAG: FGGY-family carbohydrate kinase [Planctomycetia bacterium]|nr:FGGY-family carbohydrate kinase [Planctomycetia bacterium]
MNRKILAYDLGTSGNKATLFDSDGHCIESVFVEYPTFYPQVGWYEQSPEDWFRAVVESTRKLLDLTKVSAQDISCLALSGHSLGCVPLDRNGRLLRSQTPIWSDVRAHEESSRFFQNVDPAIWYQKTGGGFSPEHYTIFKMLWYQKNEPEMLAQTQKIIGTKDYINYRLTDRIVTDPGYASGCGVWNLRNWDYDAELLQESGLSRDLFPDVIPSTGIVGNLTLQAAKELGLTEKTVVVCGSVDNSCMALGAGNTKRGRYYASLGSSSWIALSSDQLELDPQTKPYVFAHVIPGFYTIALALFSSGTTFRWVKETMCRDLIEQGSRENRNVYELMIDEAEKGSSFGANGLMMNPNFAGGASQDGCPEMRGAFFNLDLSHQRADVIRSVMEGIALGMRNVLESLFKQQSHENRMTVVGGGALSPFWRQIYADTMKISLVKNNIDMNAAALGTAALAAIGTGIWPSFDFVDQVIQNQEETNPQNKNADFYDKLYVKYLLIRDLMIQYANQTKTL